jgi:hypothetical protein
MWIWVYVSAIQILFSFIGQNEKGDTFYRKNILCLRHKQIIYVISFYRDFVPPAQNLGYANFSIFLKNPTNNIFVPEVQHIGGRTIIVLFICPGRDNISVAAKQLSFI